MARSTVCPGCGGTGRQNGEICSTCRGLGRYVETTPNEKPLYIS